ncbi:MAG TPA: SDR family oxidoreductase, partial [Paenibacillus sp.]|nr:SDR family oxidoreductase [Paenibacillus sp.]
LVGIIREAPSRGVTFARVHEEGTRRLVEACVDAGFGAGPGRRFVHMSALGARPGATTAYFRSKWTAEETVRASGIPHVVFRPSVIFGPGDEFVNMLAGLARLPITPVIGDGRYRMQPVSLRTVADVFVKALTYEPLNVAFDVGGPEQIPYNDMLREIGAAIGRRRMTLAHAPLWLMKPVVRAFERLPFFPITTNQLTMLLEENICRDGTPFYDAYDTQPIPFTAGIREYLGP